jgi:hypothetical protein
MSRFRLDSTKQPKGEHHEASRIEEGHQEGTREEGWPQAPQQEDCCQDLIVSH